MRVFLTAYLLLLLATGAGQLQAQSDAQVLGIGIPAAEYPRTPRNWTDASGHHRVLARLADVHRGGVVLETLDRGELTVPLAKLDRTSREIATDAMHYFRLERQMRQVITELQTRAAEVEDADDLAEQLIKQANVPIANTQIRLRYRVLSVSDLLPPKVSGSKTGEYLVDLRPLYRLHGMPATWISVPGTASYYKGWYFKAEELDPRKVVVGKSVVEFTGQPVIAGFGNHHFHILMRIEGLRHGIGFGINLSSVRLFTPSAAEAKEDIRLGGGVDAGPFPSDLPEAPGAATPEKLATRDAPAAAQRAAAEVAEKGEAEAVAQHLEQPAADAGKTLNDLVQREARKRIAQQLQRLQRGQQSPDPATPIGRPERRASDPSAPNEPANQKSLDKPPISVSGSDRKMTIQCDGEDVLVSGFRHQVTITGRCRKIRTSGVGHKIIVEEVAAISVSGSGNYVGYQRGPMGRPPETQQSGSKNKVEKLPPSKQLEPTTP